MFHVSLLKQWRPSTLQQVPGEVELEDARPTTVLRRRENLTVAMELKNPAAATRIFSPVARVSS